MDSNNNKANKETATKKFYYFILTFNKNNIYFFTFYLFLFLRYFVFYIFLFEERFINDWIENKYITIDSSSLSLLNFYKSISFNTYLIIFYIISGYILILCFLFLFNIYFIHSKSILNHILKYLYYITSYVLIVPFTIHLLLIFNCEKFSFQGDICFEDSIKGIRLYSIISLFLLNSICHVFNIINIDYLHKNHNFLYKSDFKPEAFILIFSFFLPIIHLYSEIRMFIIIFYFIFSAFIVYIHFIFVSFYNHKVEITNNILMAIFSYACLCIIIKSIFSLYNFTSIWLLFLFGVLPICYVTYNITIRKYFFSLSKLNTLFSQSIDIKSELFNFEDLAYRYIIYHSTPEKDKENKIFLNSYLIYHHQVCNDKECYLNTFNFNDTYEINKIKIINYIGELYNKAIYFFPRDTYLSIRYIFFCYEMKIQLTQARNLLNYYTSISDYVDKSSIDEEYINDFKLSSIDSYLVCYINETYVNNEEQQDNPNDEENLGLLNEKNKKSILNKVLYEKLTNLIENTIKIYIDVFSILTNTQQESINIRQLFDICKKSQSYILEIKCIWKQLQLDNINDEEKSILELLYSFSNEILYDVSLGNEVNSIISNEFLRNIDENGDYFNMKNIDIQLENQDLILFSRVSDKGEGFILKSSCSLSGLLGYSSHELVNKNIELIIPSIFRLSHAMMLTKKMMRFNTKSLDISNNLSFAPNSFTLFALLRSKYILPIKQQFLIKRDQELSNSYIIKSKFEKWGGKTDFSYHIVTNENMIISNLTSNCNMLGLTKEMVENQEISLEGMILSLSGNPINILNDYTDYEESKEILFYFNSQALSNKVKKKNMNLSRKRMSVVIKKYSFATLNLRVFHIVLYDIPIKINNDGLDNNVFPLSKSVNIRISTCSQRIISYNLNTLSYKLVELTDNEYKLNTNKDNLQPGKKKMTLLEKILSKKNTIQSPDKKELNIELKNEEESKESSLSNAIDTNIFKTLQKQKEEENEEESFNLMKTPISNDDTHQINSQVFSKKNIYQEETEKDEEDNEYEKNDYLSQNVIELLKGENIVKIKEYIKSLMCYSENITYMKRDYKLNLNENFIENENLIVKNIDEYRSKIDGLMQLEKKNQENNNNIGNSKNILNYKSKHDTSRLLSYIFPFKIKIGARIFLVISSITVLLISVILLVNILSSITTVKNSTYAIIYNYEFTFYSIFAYNLITKIRLYTDTSNELITEKANSTIVNDYVWNSTFSEMNVKSMWYENLSQTNKKLIKEGFFDYFINKGKEKLNEIRKELDDTFDNYQNYKQYLLSDNQTQIINEVPYKNNFTYEESSKLSKKAMIEIYYYDILLAISAIVSKIDKIDGNTKDSNYEYLKYNLMNEPLLETFKLLSSSISKVINYMTSSKIIFNLFVINISVSVFLFIIANIIISKIVLSKERIVDALFTIEKKVFNDFKLSCENYLNNLLQKLYMKNEQNEDLTYSFIVKKEDFSFVKFKQFTKYKFSPKYSLEFLIYRALITTQYLSLIIYSTVVYLNLESSHIENELILKSINSTYYTAIDQLFPLTGFQ